MNAQMPAHVQIVPDLRGHSDISTLLIMRGSQILKRHRVGPNVVHSMVGHPDGSYEDGGLGHNLLTNIGRDYEADAEGGVAAAGGQGSPATASSSTSLTGTGSVWTASNLATPQLGLAGKIVVVPITGLTTTPVMGLVGSNTSNVLTVDKWWTPDFAGTGTTPASTSAFFLLPGRGPCPFMAITTDASAASASDTALASEITTNGGARAKAAYAHTYGASTGTFINTFTFSGSFTGIHKMGLCTCSTSTAAGLMVFEAVLNQDANVGTGDTLTITDTVTWSG